MSMSGCGLGVSVIKSVEPPRMNPVETSGLTNRAQILQPCFGTEGNTRKTTRACLTSLVNANACHIIGRTRRQRNYITPTLHNFAGGTTTGLDSEDSWASHANNFSRTPFESPRKVQWNRVPIPAGNEQWFNNHRWINKVIQSLKQGSTLDLDCSPRSASVTDIVTGLREACLPPASQQKPICCSEILFSTTLLSRSSHDSFISLALTSRPLRLGPHQ